MITPKLAKKSLVDFELQNGKTEKKRFDGENSKKEEIPTLSSNPSFDDQDKQ